MDSIDFSKIPEWWAVCLGYEVPKDEHTSATPSSRPFLAKMHPKCFHIAIANAKRLIDDMYNGVKGKFLQQCLNEFCCKFNRKYFGDRLFYSRYSEGMTMIVQLKIK